MMKYSGLAGVRAALSKGETLSSVVASYLGEIEKRSDLNSFLSVYRDAAISRAKELDFKAASGAPLGRLFGMVIGVKDNIAVKDQPLSASSKILEGFVSVFNATAIERLLAEDAILIGRLNCDEFAMGSSNEHSAYGAVKNPVDTSRVPGGSSGGSAAAVAAGLCTASLGSDTGGSIRQPAAFCGVVGLKPTYGRISRHGLIAYGSSFDQIGPITASVEDSALLLEVMSGHDAYDATCSERAVPEYSALKPMDLAGVRVAVYTVIKTHSGIDPELRELFLGRISQLEQAGALIDWVDFPYLDYLVPAYYVLSTAEASSNLSRYDGIHYGLRSSGAESLDETYVKTRSMGFGAEVKRRIMTGTFVLSSGYYDAYYGKGQQARRIIQNATDKLLAQYDFIISPTSPKFPFKFGDNSKDPLAMYLEDIFTVQANLSGNPAISIPMGSNGQGLPSGFQIMANRFSESELISFGLSAEQLFQ
jgi:aspartyl-tRNA(Asn)/glutamyl-tRNA(Gln) amidotransferase subunit A